MSISEDEARESLEQVADAAKRTRKMMSYAGGDMLFMVWGIIWILGFAGNQFLPDISGWIWLVLVALGVAVPVAVLRLHAPVRRAVGNRVGKRVGLFWSLLFLYVGLWIALLYPFIKVQGQEQFEVFWRHMGAICATVPMLAYVIMGILLEHFIMWVGLAVTALTLLGLFLVPHYFFLWEAVAGGGTLLGTGIVIRTRWK